MGRGPTWRSGTGRVTLGKVRDGLGSIREVRDGSRDSPVGLVRVVGRPFWRSGTGQENFPKVRVGLDEPRGGPERVSGSFWKSGMVRGTALVVWNMSGDPPKGLGRSGDPRGGPGCVGGPFLRYGKGWGPFRG